MSEGLWWKTYWAALASTSDDRNPENAVSRARRVADLTIDSVEVGPLSDLVTRRMADWNRSPEYDEMHAQEIIRVVLRNLHLVSP